MKAIIEMFALFVLVFQILYNAFVAGTAKFENEGFLLNCLLSAGIFIIFLVEVFA